MENTPEFEGDVTSEVLNEPFSAVEAGEGDQEVSSQPPGFITSVQTKTVGEDGSVHKEANVKRKVGKDVKDREAKPEKDGHSMESINSTILVSVAVVAVVGAIIAKLALARKLR